MRNSACHRNFPTNLKLRPGATESGKIACGSAKLGKNNVRIRKFGKTWLKEIRNVMGIINNDMFKCKFDHRTLKLVKYLFV